MEWPPNFIVNTKEKMLYSDLHLLFTPRKSKNEDVTQFNRYTTL